MNKTVLSSVVMASAMAVGAAQAEPLTMSTDQMDKVTAAGIGFVDVDFDLDSVVNKQVNVTIDKAKSVLQNVDLTGFYADATAGANCSAFYCETEAWTLTDVIIPDAGGFGTATSAAYSESSGVRF